MALIHFDQITDSKEKGQLVELTAVYDNKPQFFVDKLAQGVGPIAAAQGPSEISGGPLLT